MGYNLQTAAGKIRETGGFDKDRTNLRSSREDVKAILKEAKKLSVRDIARECSRQQEMAASRKKRQRILSLTIFQKLESLREKAVRCYFAGNRSPLRSPDYVNISFTDQPEKVGARYTSADAGAYSSRCWYRKTEHTLALTLPNQWRTRVEKRGLAVVDGMFTLDAAALETRLDGIETYAVAYITQKRGFDCAVVNGFLARVDGVSFHGKTLPLALSGLAQKRAMTPQKRKEISQKLTIGKFMKEIGAFGKNTEQISVCVADAKAVGACDFGIRSWCDRVGIDYNAVCVPFSSLVAGYVEYPLPEVRATALHVLRTA